METEKRQEEQLIALIYDVREIADGRINENGTPLSSLYPDIARCFVRIVCDGVRESGKRETHNDIRAEHPT